jgi:iron-sulfur cluster repair protein YtfE (RIC family)
MSNTKIDRIRPSEQELTKWTIYELIDVYPETMSVLASLAIDLCCGGLHPLGVALDLHGYDWAQTLEKIIAVIDTATGPES